VIAAVTALYFPAAQTTQSVSASWAEATLAASERYVPAGQAEHVIAAVTALYLPATHTTQSVSASWAEATLAASER
jgi:hypothetical protein